jgi:hypothetical protein
MRARPCRSRARGPGASPGSRAWPPRAARCDRPAAPPVPARRRTRGARRGCAGRSRTRRRRPRRRGRQPEDVRLHEGCTGAGRRQHPVGEVHPDGVVAGRLELPAEVPGAGGQVEHHRTPTERQVPDGAAPPPDVEPNVMIRLTRSYLGAMASNIPRTAVTLASPSGRSSGIGEAGEGTPPCYGRPTTGPRRARASDRGARWRPAARRRSACSGGRRATSDGRRKKQR